MSEHLEMASNKKKQPNRKQPKQISFRVSESEYLNLERSAKVLNISVAKVVGAWNGSLSGWYQAW